MALLNQESLHFAKLSTPKSIIVAQLCIVSSRLGFRVRNSTKMLRAKPHGSHAAIAAARIDERIFTGGCGGSAIRFGFANAGSLVRENKLLKLSRLSVGQRVKTSIDARQRIGSLVQSNLPEEVWLDEFDWRDLTLGQ
jgi:hypothetical protein